IPPTARTPEVFFAFGGGGKGGTFDGAGTWYFNTIYRCEQDRGYAGLEDLWSPGAVRWTLSPGQTVRFVCSADPIELEKAVAAAQSQCARLDEPIVSLPAAAVDTDHDLLVRAAQTFALELASTSKAWGAWGARGAGPSSGRTNRERPDRPEDGPALHAPALHAPALHGPALHEMTIITKFHWSPPSARDA